MSNSFCKASPESVDKEGAEKGGVGQSKIEKLDAVGLVCPLPVLKARKRLRGLQAGDILVLFADDPQAEDDVKELCRASGNRLVDVTVMDGGVTKFEVIVENGV